MLTVLLVEVNIDLSGNTSGSFFKDRHDIDACGSQLNDHDNITSLGSLLKDQDNIITLESLLKDQDNIATFNCLTKIRIYQKSLDRRLWIRITIKKAEFMFTKPHTDANHLDEYRLGLK